MCKKSCLLVSLVLLLSIASISSAATIITWSNGGLDGDWNNTANWVGGVKPNTTADYAKILMATGPVFSTGRTATAYRVYLDGSNGSMTMDGGSLTVNNYLYMASLVTDSGTLTVNSGTIATTGHLYCGVKGPATLNMSGGAINVGGTFYVGRDVGSSATVSLSGGTITCAVISMRTNGATIPATINITSTGKLIIDGDVTATIAPWITSGWIKAYNGVGTVVVSTTTNPGKTTVTASAPTKPGNPLPTNNATNVSTLTDLSWTGIAEANSHNVYFGTDSTPDETEFQGNQTGTTFDPCRLDPNTRYYWQIEEVNGPNIIATGDVWTFLTGSVVATTPSPASGTIGVPTSGTNLSWTAGVTAASHNVYFGTNPTPGPSEFKVNQPTTTYTPGTLVLDTTYYWRIDEVEADANYVYTGTLWSFSTQGAFKKGTYLIYPGNNTQMTVLWQMTTTTGCTLAWGLDPNYSTGSTVTSEYGTDHQHKYTIPDLAPGTKYYYRVTAGTVTTTGSFRAAPAADATSVKFFAYGDTRTYPANHSAVCAGMNSVIAGDPDFQTVLLHTGDWVEADAETNWANEFFNRSYPAQLQTEATLPIQGCMGNHEGGATYYTKYWPYPYIAARYWSFDYGPAHIAIVDQYTDYSPGSAQLTWLTNDLSTSTKKWKFIVLHQPGWTAGGSHQNDTLVQARIQPLCEAYGVQIVFAGHNHYYSRAVVNGVHHITAGGGGAPLYNPVAGLPNIVIYNKTLHYCKITIDGNSMSVQTVKPDGTVIDQFYIEKEEPDFTFVQATDPQIGWSQCGNMDFMWGVTVNKGNIVEPNFLVVTGDLINNQGSTSQAAYYNSYAAGLKPTIPLYNVPGNHDIGDAPSPTSYAFWNANLKSPASSDPNTWYSFTYGNNLFICLDSMVLKNPTNYPGKDTEQMNWLTTTLAGASGYDNIMVFMHISLCLTSTTEADQTFNMPLTVRNQLLSLFHTYGVKAVFSGHAHYNSYVRDGELEIVTTSSCNCSLGSPVTPQGFRVVDVYPNHITHTYVPFEDIICLDGDFNCDDIVDFKDLRSLTEHWLENGIWP
jgi:predicted MPP superfamily phosphohydrolase